MQPDTETDNIILKALSLPGPTKGLGSHQNSSVNLLFLMLAGLCMLLAAILFISTLFVIKLKSLDLQIG